MNKKKTIIIMLVVGIITGLAILGFKIHSMRREHANMSYEESVAKSDEIYQEQKKKEKQIEKAQEAMPTEQKEKILQIKEKQEIAKSNNYKEYEKLPEAEKEKIEVIPRETEIPIEKLDEIVEEQKTIESELPSSFTLSDKIKINAKKQTGTGLCWDFASITSAETYLALHEQKDYVLSVNHVNYITSNLLYGTRKLNSGGNFSDFMKYLTFSDLVLEEDVPFTRKYNEAQYSEFINKSSGVTVTDVIQFPTIDKKNNTYTDEELLKFRTAVKKHIMTNGSLYAGMNSDSVNFSRYEDPKYNRDYYTSKANPNNLVINHAVSIVGWDDNYPKENFSDHGIIPEHDGAYIALNSWGDDYYTDHETGKGTPYIYVSYDDIFIESELDGILSTSFDDNSVVDFDSIKSSSIKKLITKKYNYAIKEHNGKRYVTNTLLRSVTDFSVDNKDIDIKELSMFSDINILDISNANITSLDELPSFSNLRSINLSNNKLTSVDKLAEYTNLKDVDISNNNVGNVSSLGQLNIEKLNLSNNTGVTGYENFTNLNKLSIDGIGIENIPTQFTGLTELSIANNKLNNLNGIENLTSLKSLDVSKNNIDDFSAINNYPYEEITLKYNNSGLSDINKFNNVAVNYLELKNNNIKNISGFIKNEKLYGIDLSGNKGVSGYSNILVSCLVINDADLNDIGELPYTISYLEVSNNNIANIDATSKVDSLGSLIINNNKCAINGELGNVSYLTINNTKIGDDFKISSSALPYIMTNNKEFLYKVDSSAYSYIDMRDIEYSDEISKKAKENDKVSINTYIKNIDVNAKDGVIDLTQIPEINYKDFYSLDSYIDDDRVSISRDRKKIILDGDVESITYKSYLDPYQINSIKYVLNIKKKNSLLDSIFGLFR